MVQGDKKVNTYVAQFWHVDETGEILEIGTLVVKLP